MGERGRNVGRSWQQEDLRENLSASFLPRCMECRRGLAMRKLSVRLSVKRVDCDKTKETSVQIFIPHERPFSLVF